MSKQKIVSTFDKDGNSKVAVECGDGDSCYQLTESIEKALGSVVDDKKTDDFFNVPNKQSVEVKIYE